MLKLEVCRRRRGRHGCQRQPGHAVCTAAPAQSRATVIAGRTGVASMWLLECTCKSTKGELLEELQVPHCCAVKHSRLHGAADRGLKMQRLHGGSAGRFRTDILVPCRQAIMGGPTCSPENGASDQKGAGLPAPSSPATSWSEGNGPGMPPGGPPRCPSSSSLGSEDQRCMAEDSGTKLRHLNQQVPCTVPEPSLARHPCLLWWLSPHPGLPQFAAPAPAAWPARGSSPLAVWIFRDTGAVGGPAAPAHTKREGRGPLAVGGAGKRAAAPSIHAAPLPSSDRLPYIAPTLDSVSQARKPALTSRQVLQTRPTACHRAMNVLRGNPSCAKYDDGETGEKRAAKTTSRASVGRWL